MLINIYSGGTVDRHARIVFKSPNRRRIVAPVESGKLKIAATTDLEGDSAKRGMVLVMLDNFANRRKHGVLNPRVECVVSREWFRRLAAMVPRSPAVGTD
jgi:hypothetical protein